MKLQALLDGKVTLMAGDCLDAVRTLPDNSIDSVVTDPPYALVSITKRFGKSGSAPVKVPEGGTGAYARASAGFMGKTWDTGERAFAIEFWAEVWRVLKPGGHVAAFSGTRTYHRLAVAIEDAGFEIRDQLAFCYGSGFPKSHNINKALRKSAACCECQNPIYEAHDVCSENVLDLRQELATCDAVSGGAQQDVREGVRGKTPFANEDRQARETAQAGCDQGQAGTPSGLQHDLRSVSVSDVSETERSCSERGKVLQPRLQEQGAPDAGRSQFASDEGGNQPVMEGRRDVQASEGELQGRSVCESAGMGKTDGTQGRLHHGASSSDGANVRLLADQDGGREPHRPQSIEQSSEQSRIVSDKRGSQTWGGWPICTGCGKPRLPAGLGTALKPAWEPICLARKPLAGTVAANVLEHGTGAINVDGCRVGTEPRPHIQRRNDKALDGNVYGSGINGSRSLGTFDQGRFPANLVHDGSEEVLAGFPETASGGGNGVRSELPNNCMSSKNYARITTNGQPPSAGSASRFFYTAKADASDRIGSKHPTVKPVDLMQWLVRLITPPGGTVLDPFAGTGTTGEAAWREGFKAILIEREEEYQADIVERMRLCLAGPDEKRREIVKRKGHEADAGPLFAAQAEGGQQ